MRDRRTSGFGREGRGAHAKYPVDCNQRSLWDPLALFDREGGGVTKADQVFRLTLADLAENVRVLQ